MSVLGSLMGKILGHSGNAADGKVNTTTATPPAPMTPTPSAAPAATAAPRSWTSSWC